MVECVNLDGVWVDLSTLEVSTMYRVGDTIYDEVEDAERRLHVDFIREVYNRDAVAAYMNDKDTRSKFYKWHSNKASSDVVCQDAYNDIDYSSPVVAQLVNATPPRSDFPKDLLLEAAMCAWEWALEARPDIMETAGAAQARHTIGSFAAAICEGWGLHENHAGDAVLIPYDWEFVPWFMKHCVDWELVDTHALDKPALKTDWRIYCAKVRAAVNPDKKSNGD